MKPQINYESYSNYGFEVKKLAQGRHTTGAFYRSQPTKLARDFYEFS
jgi:hypothetical protein